MNAIWTQHNFIQQVLIVVFIPRSESNYNDRNKIQEIAEQLNSWVYLLNDTWIRFVKKIWTVARFTRKR